MSKNYISIWINIMTRVISVSIESWSEFSIKDICINISSGGTPSRKVPEYYLNGVHKWIKTQELKDCNIYDTDEHITDAALKNSSAKIYPKNTISMAMYGATVGKLGIMKSECATNQACCNMVVDSTKADYRFLFYSLLYRREELIGLASGAAQQNLNVGVISNFRINLPTLSEQKVIAATLSVLDDMIELNNQINKTLEEMAQTIFKSWFVDFEPFKDGEFEESELGLIPKGWRVVELNDISKDIICGKTPSTKDNDNYGNKMPFITIPDMHGNVFITKTERCLSQKGINIQKNKTLPKFSVCVSCIATPGLVAITSEESQTNQQINSVICKDNISCFYVYLFLNTIKDTIITLGSGGSTTLNLNKRQFSKIKIIKCDDRTMRAFHNLVKPLFFNILDNQIENQNLSEIRDTLLPKLMSGEIRVPVEGVV